MVARLSADLMTQTPALVERSEHLRDLAARLAQEDAVSYGRVLDAERSVRGLEANERLGEIAAALSLAAEVPLQVAELGAAVAATAAELAEHGNPRLLGDAVTAALLAEAGARAAAVLVEINLGRTGDDDRIARAEHAVAETAGSARRARLRLEA
jgi:formiminotetrahydrofolate cyclodeaminase